MKNIAIIFFLIAPVSSVLSDDRSPSCMTGTVIASVKSYYIINCGTNNLEVLQERAPGLTTGDIVCMPQLSQLYQYDSLSPSLPKLTIIGHQTLKPPPLLQLRDVNPRLHDKQRIRIRGWIKDARIDPLDPRWMRLVLKSESDSIDIAVPRPSNESFKPTDYKYATVEISGLYRRMIPGERTFATTSIETSGTNDITILSRPKDFFDLPDISQLAGMSANEILSARAYVATGPVIAIWGRRSFLMQAPLEKVQLVRVNLDESCIPPRLGDTVIAAGLAQTDLHSISLINATYKTIASRESTNKLSINSSHFDRCSLTGRDADVFCHGKATCVTGAIREIATHEGKVDLLRLAAGNMMLNVDVSSLDPLPTGLAVGSTIELTAICIAETEVWRPGESLATYHGTTLVPQTPDDIRVLARPPWWTPGRLLSVILALIAILVGFFVWNRVLMALARRRGHELFRSEYARASAILRVSERTRLATELHDSLSQSLSGIACQVVAAKHALAGNPVAATERLAAAENMLASCRNELSNCLFDLRGDMLEEPDFSEAIRKSLALVTSAGEHTTIRVNIPRTHLHDATAHTILCIIRELVSNALRHGRAEHVRIAGCIGNGCLLLSVTDDGTGFDEKTCPGADKGHFGLTGIRDRVRRLKGKISFESVSPHGARVTITMPMPTDTNKPFSKRQ